MDTKLADSLYNVASKKGADFAALASQYSVAESSVDGGVIGKIAYSTLAPELADAFVSVRKGDVVKVAFGNAIQMIGLIVTGGNVRFVDVEFRTGEHQKIRLVHIRMIGNGVMIGQAKNLVAKGFIGFFDFFLGQLSVGNGAMGV